MPYPRTPPNHLFFRRPCKGCKKNFIPTGQHQKYCFDCIEERFREGVKKTKKTNSKRERSYIHNFMSLSKNNNKGLNTK